MPPQPSALRTCACDDIPVMRLLVNSAIYVVRAAIRFVRFGLALPVATFLGHFGA